MKSPSPDPHILDPVSDGHVEFHSLLLSRDETSSVVDVSRLRSF